MVDVVPAHVRSRMMSGIQGKNTKPEMLVRRCLWSAGVRYRLHRRDLPGAPDIVLLHSGKLATIQALPTVVARFRKAGYTFVTVSEMLAHATPGAINHPKRTTV